MFKQLLLIAFFGLLSSIQAAPTPDLDFSTNTTSIKVGESMRLTCDLSNFEPTEKPFKIFFEGGKRTIGFFLSMADPSGRRSSNYLPMPYNAFESFGFSDNGAAYEVTFVPKDNKITGDYSCRFQDEQTDIESSRVSFS